MDTFQNEQRSVQSLVQKRVRIGRACQAFGGNNYLAPAWVHDDRSTPTNRYFQEIDDYIYYEPVIQIHGNGCEFASKTLLSPDYREMLSNLAKTAKAERERLQRLNERIERSQVRRIKSAQPTLGNTGNNLEKFEKVTREKRYRIQNYIQKNRLPGKRKCDCGENHEHVYDCETCRSPGNTVCTCGCAIGDLITVKKNLEHGNLSTSGTATCGSVWACPVCRAKIVNEKSKQLNKIYNEGSQKGWHFYLFTFTVPHKASDNLAELYGSSSLKCGLSGAFTNFRSSYCYSKQFKKDDNIGFIGDVKAVEVTYGIQNGFHPHIHFIVITKNKIDQAYWYGKFLKEWKRQAVKAGLNMPNERGLDIAKANHSDMVEYLCKWSVGAEMTSDTAKKAKGRNYSIAQLELMLIDERYRLSTIDAFSLDRVAGILAAYYKAMHGQKQLQYGNLQTGWRDEFIKDDKTDEELASDQDDQEITHTEVFTIGKGLYKELKRKGIFSEFMESIELIELGTPLFRDLSYQKAKTLLWKYDLTDKELYQPGQTIHGK